MWISAVVLPLKCQFSWLPGRVADPRSCLLMQLPLNGARSNANPGAGSSQTVVFWVSVCRSSDTCKRMPLLWRTPDLDGKLINLYCKIFENLSCYWCGSRHMDLCTWKSMHKLTEVDFFVFLLMCCVWHQENGKQFLENKVIAKMHYPHCRSEEIEFSKPLWAVLSPLEKYHIKYKI